MAIKTKYNAWVGTPGGGGQARNAETGELVDFDQKPPESSFVAKPAGAPKGDFIRTGFTSKFDRDAEGKAQLVPGSDFTSLNDSQQKAQFLEDSPGGTIDRKARRELEMRRELGGRMAAKGEVDSQNMSFGYTAAQDAKIAAIDNSWNEIATGLAEGVYTPDQAADLNTQLAIQKDAILPQKLKRPPSPQQAFDASVVTLPNGRVGQVDKNGIFKEIETGVTFKDFNQAKKDAYESLSNTVTSTDKEGNETFATPTSEEVTQLAMQSLQSFAEFSGLYTGASTGQQPPQGPSLDRPVTGGQLEQKQELQAQRAFKQLGLSEDTMQKALAAEGSYGAALRKFSESVKGGQKGKLTKEQFKKTARKSTGTVPTTEEFRSLSGAGGAGGGRF